jgi:hypothetical protein
MTRASQAWALAIATTLALVLAGVASARAATCPPALDFTALRAQLDAQGLELVGTKIGFHVGPGGNQTGLGDWMQCLDAAGVPFTLKSADSAGQILEGAQLRQASRVPHVLVYRKSVVTASDPEQNWNPDVPEYALPPQSAAALHWQRHRVAFPPELVPYKHLIWIETINEVDKNRAEWLGEFAYHTAQLALAEGFNWAAFGWSTGEPEPEHWQGPKMRQFLELAGQNPGRVAVALHEYSLDRDDISIGYPFLVGRFQELFDVADSFGIRRPTVLVTEFGWEYQDVPSPSQAIGSHVPWSDQVYAPEPEIQGAAIWYLGPGFGGISNQAQQLIAPLTDYSLQSYSSIPRPRGKPRTPYAREYWVVDGRATLAQLQEIARQAHPGRVTVGFSYDDAGIGDLDVRRVVVWGDEIDKNLLLQWYGQYYGGVSVEFRALPGQGTWSFGPYATTEPVTRRGTPRTPYTREYWVVDSRASLVQLQQVVAQAQAGRKTVGFSYDDAGVGDLAGRQVVVWGNEHPQPVLIDWYQQHYPGVTLTFRSLP